MIEDKRKLLYPEMKRARENKQNKVRLVRDRLYINNAQYVPRLTQNPDNIKNRDTYQQRHAGSRNQWYENQSYSTESNSSSRENGSRTNKGYNSRSRVYHRSSNQKTQMALSIANQSKPTQKRCRIIQCLRQIDSVCL